MFPIGNGLPQQQLMWSMCYFLQFHFQAFSFSAKFLYLAPLSGLNYVCLSHMSMLIILVYRYILATKCMWFNKIERFDQASPSWKDFCWRCGWQDHDHWSREKTWNWRMASKARHGRRSPENVSRKHGFIAFVAARNWSKRHKYCIGRRCIEPCEAERRGAKGWQARRVCHGSADRRNDERWRT